MPATPDRARRESGAANARAPVGIIPNEMITQDTPASGSRADARERLVTLLVEARAEVARVAKRAGHSPFSPEFSGARALGLELDEIQRTVSYVREQTGLELPPVLRRMAGACTGPLAGVRESLERAGALADLLMQEQARGS
jgi:hypothetical protein